MPAYLVHGFKWPRQLIRIHIILHHLDDATANWLVSPTTMRVLLEDFIESFPDPMSHLPNLRFVEQYDPDDYANKAEAFAFVADVAEEVKLSVDVKQFLEMNAPAEPQTRALEDLKTALQVESDIGWFVVNCTDLVRAFPADGSARSFLDKEYEPRRRERGRRRSDVSGRSRPGSSSGRRPVTAGGERPVTAGGERGATLSKGSLALERTGTGSKDGVKDAERPRGLRSALSRLFGAERAA